VVVVGFPSQAPAESSDNWRLMLREGWVIQPSAQARAAGDVLSTARYAPKGWCQASVPTTALNALVRNKVYPDPYFGMNLRSIPGTQYPIGENFANSPMPSDSPFNGSWWFRRKFQLLVGSRTGAAAPKYLQSPVSSLRHITRSVRI